MTRNQLLNFHQECCDRARDILDKKNKDYAGDSDPFRNFRRHGLEGVTVRISDKLSRLECFIAKGELAVEEETIMDTCIDLMNYSILFAALASEGKNGN